MMHNKQPYSFEKTDVRGRFLLNFSCTKVQSNDVSPIAGNLSLTLKNVRTNEANVGICVVAFLRWFVCWQAITQIHC